MRIQPCYANKYNTQPVFKANFDYQDAETRENLINFTRTPTTSWEGEYNVLMIWSLMKELEKIDSDDLLTIEFKKGEGKRKYGDLIIKNKRTKNSITITMEQYVGVDGEKSLTYDLIIGDNIDSVSLNVDNRETTNNTNIAEHLYRAIFSDYGMLKLFNIDNRKDIWPGFQTRYNVGTCKRPELIYKGKIIRHPDFVERQLHDDSLNSLINLDQIQAKKDKCEKMIKEIDTRTANLQKQLTENYETNKKGNRGIEDELNRLREDRKKYVLQLTELILKPSNSRKMYVCTKIDTMA